MRGGQVSKKRIQEQKAAVFVQRMLVPLHGKPARLPGAYQAKSNTAVFGMKWI